MDWAWGLFTQTVLTQVPRTSETYVHRSGRTARATKEGLSLLLIGPDDMMNFKKIYRTLGKEEEFPMFPIETKCLEAVKVGASISSSWHLKRLFDIRTVVPQQERVKLARQIEKIEFHNSRQKHHDSWLRQAAEALEVDLDDDLLLGNAKRLLPCSVYFNNGRMKTTEHIIYVSRQSKGRGGWQKAADDGEGHEKAAEAFDLAACVQERDEDQVPHSNGKALPASHSCDGDRKRP